jgi:hypothetical protein
MSNERDDADFINRQSFIELDARERAKTLFDAGTVRELLGPFDHVESPWLPIQGVTPQADDGCVVMKGTILGQAAVVVALEGAFQGGSMGEVSGAKMTAALDLACADNEKGIRTNARHAARNRWRPASGGQSGTRGDRRDHGLNPGPKKTRARSSLSRRARSDVLAACHSPRDYRATSSSRTRLDWA